MTSPRPGHERGAAAPPSSPVDWALAEQIARRVARRKPAPTTSITTGEIAPMAAIAEERIAATTGLRSSRGPAQVQIVDRDDWIAANICSFRELLEPVIASWTQRRAAKSARAGRRTAGPNGASRRVAAVELGVLLGWMSTRVLGQYDTLVGDTGAGAGDAVYLVGPNIVGLERRFGFPPHEFRQWVTTHELTHRAQFTGVPWMREHFLGLVHESLALANPDPAALASALRDVVRDRSELRRRMADGGLIAVMATPEQRAVLAQIGGLMSLLEGHGDVTMNRAVADVVPHAQRFHDVLQARRAQVNPLGRLIQRLAGLEAKLAQYAAGEQFIAAVEAAAGPHAIDICWREPANLPTLDEIRAPQRWLERLGDAVVRAV